MPEWFSLGFLSALLVTTWSSAEPKWVKPWKTRGFLGYWLVSSEVQMRHQNTRRPAVIEMITNIEWPRLNQSRSYIRQEAAAPKHPPIVIAIGLLHQRRCPTYLYNAC